MTRSGKAPSTGSPPDGLLVEVEHAGQTVIAVLQGQRSGRLRICTEEGHELEISPAKLLYRSDYTLAQAGTSPGGDPADGLRALRQRIEEAKQSFDLETIWEMALSDRAESLTEGEVAALWFGETGAVETFATREQLRENTLYFKARGQQFYLRSEQEVEAARIAAARESERMQEEQSFVGEVARALAATAAGAAAPDLTDSPASRRYLDVLTDFAAYGDAYARKDDAKHLLGRIDEGRGRSPGRGTPFKAFDLLRQLGLLSEHQNLALRRHHIRTRFDDELLALAHRLAGQRREVDDEVTEDLTDLEVFTIDDPMTTDMDDALHARAAGDGSIEIGIHITDVGALIDPETPLDLEARRRGSSLYLPSGVIPMLPEVLSNDALSLVVGEPRPTLSFLLEFDADYMLRARRLALGRVSVRHRLTYDEADAIMEREDSPLHASLLALDQIARHCQARRRSHGAIDIELPEVKVHVTNGEVAVRQVERRRSRALISELMVMAGEQAAAVALDHRIPTVFRTQPHPLDAPPRPGFDRIDDELVRDMELVRQMRRGELRSEPSPHRGLGLDAYVQVTSPMRRYADLVVNYQLRRFLSGVPLAFDGEAIVAVAAQAENAAQACTMAQRESDRYWLLEYLRRRSEEPTRGVVLYFDATSQRRTIPILLRDTLLRTNVFATRLEPGDEVMVRVVKADPRRDTLKVELV